MNNHSPMYPQPRTFFGVRYHTLIDTDLQPPTFNYAKMSFKSRFSGLRL